MSLFKSKEQRTLDKIVRENKLAAEREAKRVQKEQLTRKIEQERILREATAAKEAREEIERKERKGTVYLDRDQK